MKKLLFFRRHFPTMYKFYFHDEFSRKRLNRLIRKFKRDMQPLMDEAWGWDDDREMYDILVETRYQLRELVNEYEE